MKTVKDLFFSFKKTLSPIYSNEEISSFFFIVLEEVAEISKAMFLANGNLIIEPQKKEEIKTILRRLSEAEPIQQILGKTTFYGLEFNINKDVLIPRPETEELVELALGEINKSKAINIIDVGSGSGCIAIALKKNLPNASLKALEINEKALYLAKTNAKKNQVSIDFKQMDFFKCCTCPKNCLFDVIISNPPYIKHSEKKLMHKNVLEFEPEKALFVPEDQPLVFYEAIAKFAENHLSAQGMIFLEINENHGPETQKLFSNKIYAFSELMQDLNGKDRFIFAQKK